MSIRHELRANFGLPDAVRHSGCAIDLIDPGGHILEATHDNYTYVFLMCGFAYLAALLVIHALAPQLERASLDDTALPRR